jgi:hypothetical protein
MAAQGVFRVTIVYSMIPYGNDLTENFGVQSGVVSAANPQLFNPVPNATCILKSIIILNLGSNSPGIQYVVWNNTEEEIVDYLDAFGNPATFGKQIGGDIIENKKTYLYLKAIEFASAEEKAKLLQLFSVSLEENKTKIEEVKSIFNTSGASNATQQAIQDYTLKAFATLDKMNISPDKKAILKSFGENLMNRNV